MSKPRTKWGIRVTFTNGREAWLRRGAQIGRGPIVEFSTRKDAELNAEAMVKPGLDDGAVVAVVAIDSRF